jgi:hypothetical protein
VVCPTEISKERHIKGASILCTGGSTVGCITGRPAEDHEYNSTALASIAVDNICIIPLLHIVLGC